MGTIHPVYDSYMGHAGERWVPASHCMVQHNGVVAAQSLHANKSLILVFNMIIVWPPMAVCLGAMVHGMCWPSFLNIMVAAF